MVASTARGRCGSRARTGPSEGGCMARRRRYEVDLSRLASEQALERARLSEAQRGATLLLPKAIVVTGAAGLLAGGVLAGIARGREGAARADVAQRDAENDLHAGRVF